MSRYLNEGAVWSAVKRIPHITMQTRQAILEALRKVPSADVVEVVRCKDCTEWDKDEYECSHWYGFREDDYCSYGARMDGKDGDME